MWKELTLDSALRLKSAPTSNARRKIHGHTYTLRLHLSGPLDEVMGWTIDFGDVKEAFSPIFKTLDHQPLQEITDLEDNDCASIARWIKAKAAPKVPGLDRVDLYETRGSGAILSWGGRAPVIPI
ncbi:MAG: 6-carboxytetrahydropterin synthase [Pseudomonadales bacterium]